MNELSQEERDYPKFANQCDEDAYWAKQHAEAEARGLAAFANGTVTRGGAARLLSELRVRRAASAADQDTNGVELDPADAFRARRLAALRGVEYQTLVKELVHEALERELSAAS